MMDEDCETNNTHDVSDASGASSENFTSADLTAGYHSIFNPTVSTSLCELSLNSRDGRNKKNDEKQTKKQKRGKKPTKTSKSKSSESDDEMIPEEILEESKQGIDSSIPCKFDQIVYKDNVNDKTYSFRYFRPFKLDWRMLLNHPNGEPVICKCPRGRLHSQQCPWYHPDIINILITNNDLSTSEQAAQGKIYSMYENTKESPLELCECGTAAEIAYLGHKSTCEEFQWINERSSYEVLLAILKKRKKIHFSEHSGNKNNQSKKRRLQTINEDDVPNTGKTEKNLQKALDTATSSLAVLAEVAQSQPPQNSLPELVGEQDGGTNCMGEEDQEMPPLEGDDATEL